MLFFLAQSRSWTLAQLGLMADVRQSAKQTFNEVVEKISRDTAPVIRVLFIYLDFSSDDASMKIGNGPAQVPVAPIPGPT